jgi:cobalt/nickel transport system ATP-binding protein
MKGEKKNIILEVNNLNYTYPDGNSALKNITFRVRDGETIGLVGPNGAGKSTLLLMLLGIIQLTNGDGSIKIMGSQLTKKTVQELRKNIGLVFQDPDDQLFMSTVFDDVAFGPINMGMNPERVQKRVKLALTKVGLPNYESRCPHHLSFGEKKRIALATVLSMHPKIMLLDEPTANLDPRARNKIIELINNFNSVKMISSHDIELLIRTCDKILLLDNGKLVANGNPQRIFNDEQLLVKHGLEQPTAIKVLGDRGFKFIKAQE